jgi:N-ethylmaleimide reductase
MKLLDPITVGKIKLSNRVIMAPLTRKRSTDDHIPVEIMQEYYRQRAGAGLIISEATNISPNAVGYANTPGIWTNQQVKEWMKITDAVHRSGGRVFLQLWHVGRHSHPVLLAKGLKPVAPSALADGAPINTPNGYLPSYVPEPLTPKGISDTVNEYRIAAKNAIDAGFDGVEVHGANSYLIHQFLMDGSNKRTDEYGGSLDNRMRFLHEVIDAVVSEIGSDRTGLRLSPGYAMNGMRDSDRLRLFESVISSINNYNLAFLHLTESSKMPDDTDEWIDDTAKHFRKFYNGKLIICGGFDLEKANRVIEEGSADMVAFGRLYISNPDLAERFRDGSPLNPWDQDTFYEGGEKGYTDYPLRSSEF